MPVIYCSAMNRKQQSQTTLSPLLLYKLMLPLNFNVWGMEFASPSFHILPRRWKITITVTMFKQLSKWNLELYTSCSQHHIPTYSSLMLRGLTSLSLSLGNWAIETPLVIKSPSWAWVLQNFSLISLYLVSDEMILQLIMLWSAIMNWILCLLDGTHVVTKYGCRTTLLFTNFLQHFPKL